MSDQTTLAEIERRIQIVEDNLRLLQQQAAAYSGARPTRSATLTASPIRRRSSKR